MNQQSQPQPTSLYPVERGDELSLIELWKVLVEYKLLIIVFTALTTLGAIYYASTLPTIYKAEVLMIPASGGISGSGLSNRLGGLADMAGVSLGGSSAGAEGEQVLARLKTRSFLTKHIKEKNLKPILFADQWDRVEKKWIDKEPSDRDSAELLKNMIEAGSHPRSKAGLASLSIEWKNPHNPNKIADIANNLVSSINSHAKDRAILEARDSISFLEKELEQTSIVNSQTILYSLIEQQMGKIMMANIRDEFVFKVIDPAVNPKHAETKPILMVIFIGIILGIFLASFLAISANYFKGQSAGVSST
jgi:capsular polysaccharide biosynthesis protein